MSAHIPLHIQEGATATDQSQLACPFCKIYPVKWLMHEKCKGYKCRTKFYDFVRWHIIGTHENYNKRLPPSHDDYVDPKLFDEVRAWLGVRGKDWKNPEPLWYQVYHIVARGLGMQISGALPTPYFNEEWMRDCWPGRERMNAIDAALIDRDLESARVIVRDINVRKESANDSEIRLRRIAEYSYGAAYAVELEISDLRYQADQKILELKQQLLALVGSPITADSLLQQGPEVLADQQSSSEWESYAVHQGSYLMNDAPAMVPFENQMTQGLDINQPSGRGVMQPPDFDASLSEMQMGLLPHDSSLPAVNQFPAHEDPGDQYPLSNEDELLGLAFSSAHSQYSGSTGSMIEMPDITESASSWGGTRFTASSSDPNDDEASRNPLRQTRLNPSTLPTTRPNKRHRPEDPSWAI